ncbi:hypothetical protein IFR05_015654 [Cadophora sp. M221]|nr:hypothetical protein IFR05_015654 [Cadophora sp. M221]
MDHLTAIGLASNIIAFVDFAGKLVSQGHEIYKSASGALQENVDINNIVTDLSLHVNKLKEGNAITAPTQREQQLQSLASKCSILAEEISQKLKKLNVLKSIADRHAQAQMQEDQRKEDLILQHLSFPTLIVRYESIDPAHAKTFNWIFEGFKPSDPNSTGFPEWLEGKGDSLFWINGKAGSGKSTLMKYIYDDPRTRERLSIWAGANDISTYAKGKLVDDPMVAELRLEQDWDPSQLVSRIVERANGVFQWVVLVVRSLLSGIDKFDDFEKLMDRLNDIPQDLMKVFAYMLRQIEPQYRVEGLKIFAMADRGLIMAQLQQQSQGSNFSGGHYEELCMLESRFGNRRLQYVHRSAKEFPDLEETKAVFQKKIPAGYDPKISLLWSAIQRIRIYEPEPYRPLVDRSAKNDILCLADSALLLAQGIQQEGKECPHELLDILDITMRSRYSNQSIPWVTEAMYKLYSYHSRYRKPYSKDEAGHTVLKSNATDDFLSLAIIYGLLDYVQLKITRDPLLVKQKKGRPYLDYALTAHKNPSVNLNPRVVQVLLNAGAEPNEYCPTIYSIPECEESASGRYIDFGYTTWTPWQSTLQSILQTAAGRLNWRSRPLTPQHCQAWIVALKDLLAKKPDVGVVTWVLFKRGPDEPYTMLIMVKDLADAQGCALYSREAPSERYEATLEAKDESFNIDVMVGDGDASEQLGNMTI